jgi:hypothetical protein
MMLWAPVRQPAQRLSRARVSPPTPSSICQPARKRAVNVLSRQGQISMSQPGVMKETTASRTTAAPNRPMIRRIINGTTTSWASTVRGSAASISPPEPGHQNGGDDVQNQPDLKGKMPGIKGFPLQQSGDEHGDGEGRYRQETGRDPAPFSPCENSGEEVGAAKIAAPSIGGRDRRAYVPGKALSHTLPGEQKNGAGGQQERDDQTGNDSCALQDTVVAKAAFKRLWAHQLSSCAGYCRRLLGLGGITHDIIPNSLSEHVVARLRCS